MSNKSFYSKQKVFLTGVEKECIWNEWVNCQIFTENILSIFILVIFHVNIICLSIRIQY